MNIKPNDYVETKSTGDELKPFSSDALLGDVGELLQCPFCGCDAEIIYRGNEYTKKRSVEIKCKNCNTVQITGAIRFDMNWCMKKAVEKWNRRANFA